MSDPHDDTRPLEVPLPPSLAEAEVPSGRETVQLGHCLVTGGAGFLGRHLAFELVRRGHRVRVFDLQPIDYHHERLEALQGDVSEMDDLRKACEGIDTVFHTAAVLDFARFASESQRELSQTVNVRGVENTLAAASAAGVKRFIHTSSNNVTFDQAVIDGDETLPYATGARDLYTQTKIQGEKHALEADTEGGMRTCAIRPGGIYGPGEKLVFPRVVDECATGRYIATIGDGTALSDNTYVDNLVDGQIRAAEHLLPGSPLCGQAYFITDGQPINYFDFFRPAVEALGFRHPRFRMPAAPLMAIMTVWEFLHWTLRIPRPMLLPLELRKITISHYNRIDKARRDFGWTPPVTPEAAMERCIEYCRELLAEKRG